MANASLTRAAVNGVPSRIPAFYLWPLPWGHGHTNCCQVPSTSRHLCYCKVWSCHVQRLRRRCIDKKELYCQGSHKMLPSTLHIMWSMHLQNLKLLKQTVEEKRHLQEATLIIQSIAQYIMWYMHLQSLKLLCPTVKEKMHLQENTLLTFDLDPKFKVIWSVAQYPLHYVTYAPAKFQVAISNSLGGGAFTRKYNIWPLTLTLGSRSHETWYSSVYIKWPMHLQSLKLLCPTV